MSPLNFPHRNAFTQVVDNLKVCPACAAKRKAKGAAAKSATIVAKPLQKDLPKEGEKEKGVRCGR